MVKQKRTEKKRPAKKRSMKPFLLIGIGVLAVVIVGVVFLYSGAFRPPQTQAATVGIVDQFYNESPAFTDNIVAFLQSKNITYELHTNQEVNVELYKELPTFGYRLIILRVHCGISEGYEQPTFMFTTENYTNDKYVYEQVTDQIKPGVIDINKKEDAVFSVGPLFVSSSMEGNFNGSLIIISSCYGMHNTQLADSLIRKGASALISWNGSSLDHTDDGIYSLTKAFIGDGLTINASVSSARSSVGPDPSFGSVLEYYPSANGTETWADLISSHT